MHAETIHAIAVELIHDDSEISLRKNLQQLIQAVEKRLAEPNQPANDAAVTAAAQNLYEQLKHSRTHNFGPTWRKLIVELDLSLLMADTLRDRIERAISENRIDTPLKQALDTLHQEIKGKHNALNQLHQSSQALGIGLDELKEDEYELKIMIPRSAFGDNLRGFNVELTKLHRQLVVLSKITTSPQDRFEIRSVSSNDFMVSLNVNVDLVDIILFALIGLQHAHIRERERMEALKQTFKDLPGDLYDGIRQHAQETIGKAVDELVGRLRDSVGEAVSPERLGQHQTQLKEAFSRLAELIERGFNIDVRAWEPPDEEELTDEHSEAVVKAIHAKRARLQKIVDQSASLRLLQKSEVEILQIEAQDDGDPSEES